MKNSEIKKLMSHLGKLSHKKNPRGKEFYSAMSRKRWDKVVDNPVDNANGKEYDEDVTNNN